MPSSFRNTGESFEEQAFRFAGVGDFRCVHPDSLPILLFALEKPTESVA